MQPGGSPGSTNAPHSSDLAARALQLESVSGTERVKERDSTGRKLPSTQTRAERPISWAQARPQLRRRRRGAILRSLSPAACRLREAIRTAQSVGRDADRSACFPMPQKGRLSSHTPEAEGRRVAARRRNAHAEAVWTPSDQPVWLTEHVYFQEIQPRLARIAAARLAAALQVSKPYAAGIRAGRQRPQPCCRTDVAS